MHAAAGNQRGVDFAAKWHVLKVEETERTLPEASRVARMFPVDPGAGGLITPEEIAALREKR